MPATRKETNPKSERKTKKATGVETAAKKTVPPAAKRSATATTAKPKAATKANTTTRHARSARIDPEQRRHYVEVAAYYIAERRGFATGDEAMDWLAAEAEIDRLLREGILNG